MFILIYNPISRNGNNHLVTKLSKKLINQGETVEVVNVFHIGEIKKFLAPLKETDTIIIIGGDGTINRIANRIYDLEIKPSIKLYQKGTGNDFARSLETKDKIIDIKKYLSNLPTVTQNGKTKHFLNGVGLGIDGYVCHLVNNQTKKKSKLNYFLSVLRAFRNYKLTNGTFVVDGETIKHDDVWLSVVMNSKYIGGGMKIAPLALRESPELYLVVIHTLKKKILPFILPTIYSGKHVKFTKWVSIYKGSEISIKYDSAVHFQMDGDTEFPVNQIDIKSF
ncbi:MAG: YegS/Rv2252/BmrU family lipid kinase [Acholeplasmatales bacterium]|jgi:YegS/Rv2252/BmrU family lipid kinase|nr:YegS/Rv2252/BmrU family lipid kinase [Acholeplasmatales bacterium]